MDRHEHELSMTSSLSNLLKFLKRYRYQDPSTGIEYNSINLNKRVSYCWSAFDIARSTNIQRQGYVGLIDVHRKTNRVNKETTRVRYANTKNFNGGSKDVY